MSGCIPTAHLDKDHYMNPHNAPAVLDGHYTYPARPMNGGPYKPERGLKQFAYKPELHSYTGKYNGWAMKVHVPTRLTFNRYNEPLSIGDDFKESLACLCATMDAEAFKWLHVEGLERRHNIGKGSLFLLDVIPTPEYADTSYHDRMDWAVGHLPVHQLDQKPEPNSVYQVMRFNAADLDHNWRLMQECNRQWGCEFYEGVVAARNDAPYPVQLRSPDEATTTRIKHRWKW